jgi:hypothetical protein
VRPNKVDIAASSAPNKARSRIDNHIADRAAYSAEGTHITTPGKIRPGINTRIAGQQFGSLMAAYSADNGRRVVCYCVCDRQVQAAPADLKAGVVTSCGCQPASPQFWIRHAELRAQQRREITFSIARAR